MHAKIMDLREKSMLYRWSILGYKAVWNMRRTTPDMTIY